MYYYWQYNKTVIVKISKDEEKRIAILKKNEIDSIATYTKNTFQPNRDIEEIKRDTAQGKIAEFIFFKVLERYQGRYLFKDYDSIREDEFKKHAPYDALIYPATIPNESILTIENKIKNDVKDNKYGNLSLMTKKTLRDNNLILVEIKSSIIPPREKQYIYNNIDAFKFEAISDCEKEFIDDHLNTLDIFAYPRYLRKDGTGINDFNAYINYVRRKFEYYASCNENDILKKELETAYDYYTRIFIDDTHKEYRTYYIPGAISAEKLFGNKTITKFYKPGKTELALYYICPILKAESLKNLFS